MTDDERYDWAIAHELKQRVEDYGGINAYCRDHDIDKRNFDKYLSGRENRHGVIKPSIPRTSALMTYISYFGITPNEFFDSVNERVDRSE